MALALSGDEKVKNAKNIALLTNSDHILDKELEKLGINTRVFFNFPAIKQAITQENYEPDLVLINWGDRDVWRALEILPVYIPLYNLYSPLFRVGLDHNLNKKFIQRLVGTSETCSEFNRSNLAWDNKAFIYKFNNV